MNTIMEEKIKKAFEEWKEQPKGNDMTKTQSTANILLDQIDKQPGVTGKELRGIMARVSPKTPITYIPALLKQLYDTNYVSRVPVPKDDGENGRATFAYTRLTDAQRTEIKRKPKPVKSKNKAKTKNTGISTLVPWQPPPVMPVPEASVWKQKQTKALAVGPTTLSITISTGDSAYTLRLDEAKFIYQQLHQIFGGVR